MGHEVDQLSALIQNLVKIRCKNHERMSARLLRGKSSYFLDIFRRFSGSMVERECLTGWGSYVESGKASREANGGANREGESSCACNRSVGKA